jgi:hypothetical protein
LKNRIRKIDQLGDGGEKGEVIERKKTPKKERRGGGRRIRNVRRRA